MNGRLTVRDLIKLLAYEDQSRVVILAKSPEDRLDAPKDAFSFVGEIGTAAYRARGRGCCDIGLEDLDSETVALGACLEDVLVGGRPALVIRPIC